MKHPIKALSLAVCLASAVVMPAQAADKKILLKMPIAFNSKLPSVGTTATYIEETLNKTSGGTIRVKKYEPGKLIGTFEILDAVAAGKVNAGFGSPGYWVGKIPAASVFSSVPFGPEAGEYMAWVYHGNGRKLWQEMYDTNGYNVHAIPCAVVAPETSGWFSKPIEKPEDLQGLSMRFFGLGGEVMQKLGVNTSLLPSSEIFPALEKGAIDATEFSMPVIDQMIGLHKVAKYNYYPGWHQQATLLELLINKNTWNKMSDTQQALVETTCRSAMAVSFAEGEALQFAAMNKNVNENGVHNMRWNDEMLDLFRTTWEEVAAEKSAADPFFAKAYSDLQGFREEYKIWKENAFMPRRPE